MTAQLPSRFPVIACLLLALFLRTAAAASADDAKYRTPEALRDLGRAHKIRLVYFVPKDREPTAHHTEKIAVLMTFVADLYREDFRAKKLPATGPDFEFRDGRPLVHLLRSTNTAAWFSGEPEFNGNRQWDHIVPEVERALGSLRTNLYVIFCETYSEGPVKFEWAGGFALGGRTTANGGAGLFSGWILRDEFCATNVARQLGLLDDATPIKGRVANHHRRPDSARFEFIEDGFGAVAHELGHALGLPHDTRQDTQSIMGNGFRYLRHNYLKRFADQPRVGFSEEHARFLRFTRFLGEDIDLTDNGEPRFKLSYPTRLKPGATEVPITLDGEDDRALGAFLVFDPQRDTTIGGASLSGKTVKQEFKIPVKPLKAGDLKLRVNFTDRSGNQVTAKVEIKVDETPASGK